MATVKKFEELYKSDPEQFAFDRVEVEFGIQRFGEDGVERLG